MKKLYYVILCHPDCAKRWSIATSALFLLCEEGNVWFSYYLIVGFLTGRCIVQCTEALENSLAGDWLTTGFAPVHPKGGEMEVAFFINKVPVSLDFFEAAIPSQLKTKHCMLHHIFNQYHYSFFIFIITYVKLLCNKENCKKCNINEILLNWASFIRFKFGLSQNLIFITWL